MRNPNRARTAFTPAAPDAKKPKGESAPAPFLSAIPTPAPTYRNSGVGETTSRNAVMLFTALIFVVVAAVVLALNWLLAGTITILGLVLALVLAVLLAMSVHVVQQWEKAVVLRLGKFSRVRGPGLFLIVPFIDSCTTTIDMRTRSTPFGAEQTLTADLVPLDVDAVLYWMVWDAKLAATEVADFALSVELSAQTALRDAIGRASVADVAIRRKQLDKELAQVLADKVEPWGISILSVEIRDIIVPAELQDVMSAEAQAEQKKKARIILMEAEQDISEMLAQISDTYSEHDEALRLRLMHLMYESVRETGGTVVIPSSFSEGFSDILPDLAKQIKK